MMRFGALLPLLLAGCAGSLNGYPSLAPRAAERVSVLTPIADTTTSSPPASAALSARLNALSAGAQAGSFGTLATAAEGAVARARGAGVDSDPWLEAQEAISRAESAIVPTAAALTELDELVTDLRLLAAAEPGTGGLSEALRARAVVAERHGEQVRRVEALRAGLR